MSKKLNIWTDLAELVEEQLNLQVKMQFKHHHQFMLDSGLVGGVDCCGGEIGR
jgi:hypothetical protein